MADVKCPLIGIAPAEIRQMKGVDVAVMVLFVRPVARLQGFAEDILAVAPQRREKENCQAWFALGFIRANWCSPIIRRVRSVSGTCRLTTSEV